MRMLMRACLAGAIVVATATAARAAQSESPGAASACTAIAGSSVEALEHHGDRVFVVPAIGVREKTSDGVKMSIIDGPVSIAYEADGVHVERAGQPDRIFAASAMLVTSTAYFLCAPNATLPLELNGKSPMYVVP